MNEKPTDQYNLATPDSRAVRIGAHMRQQMFDTFMSRFNPTPQETVLDLGKAMWPVSNVLEMGSLTTEDGIRHRSTRFLYRHKAAPRFSSQHWREA
jgi:hypothetical protein